MKLNDIAKALTLSCNQLQVAEIISALLSCEDIEDITDEQAEAGRALFDELCKLAPEAVAVAQSM